MIESGSSIQTFQTCQRLYKFKYVDLLDTRSYSSSLGFGTFMHACVEEYGKNLSGVVERELDRLITQKGQEQAQQIDRDRILAQRFFSLWVNHWERSPIYNSHDFTWIAVEDEWAFKVGNNTHAGKSDGVIQDKNTGAMYLYELKTATDRDRESYIHKLEIDRQVSSNILAQRLKGRDIVGVIYDIVWKPGIRKLTGRKTKPDETDEEFADRMVASASEDTAKTFERHMVYRSDRLLDEHMSDLRIQFQNIENAMGAGFCRNTASCNDFGRVCPFFSACLEGRDELKELYQLKSRKLPELSEEINANT